MICKDCKNKPVNTNGVIEKCIKCGENAVFSKDDSRICKDCSDEHNICSSCGKSFSEHSSTLFKLLYNRHDLNHDLEVAFAKNLKGEKSIKISYFNDMCCCSGEIWIDNVLSQQDVVFRKELK